MTGRRGDRLRNLNLPVATILRNPQRDWGQLTRGHVRIAADRRLSVDWKTFTRDKFLFAHSTIVSSVKVASNHYYIEPPCDELVNSNGNAWSTPVLLATFRSFIGRNNYVEHLQVPAMSKGTILDAVARPVKFAGENGDEADVVYVDILVAVDRRHADLVDRIERGELRTMSMGCLAKWVQCSKCGKQIDDSMKNCTHLDNELMQYFVDENGVRRIVAELCGRMVKNPKTGEIEADPESVEFIEGSWVEKPAFKGAVLNHFVQDNTKVATILELPTDRLQEAVEDIFRMRVADRQGMLALRVARDLIIRMRRTDVAERLAYCTAQSRGLVN